MRLTLKLIFWFVLVVAIGVGLNGYFEVRAELRRFRSDLELEHATRGRALKATIEEVVKDEGEVRAMAVFERAAERYQLIDMRWVELDEGEGTVGQLVRHKRRLSLDSERLAHLRRDESIHEWTNERQMLISYTPIRHADGRVAALEFAENVEREGVVVREMIKDEITAVALILSGLVLGSAVLGVLLVGRPVHSLAEHARRIGGGDLSQMPPLGGKDELADLRREMNTMCRELESIQRAHEKATEQLRHADRLKTVGTLASGMAHELGTPLNVILLRAKSIASHASDNTKGAALTIVEQASRMTELVEHLLEFARRRKPQKVVVSPDELVSRVAHLLGPALEKKGVALEKTGDPSDRIVADPGQLEQVMTNLVLNALHAEPKDGKIMVRWSARDATPPEDPERKAKPSLLIEVIDRGVGIPKEDIQHLFEPFFTTKEVRQGTGLGLPICYGIVRDHDGWIEVKSELGVGSTFSIFLPKGAS
ncbi:MAG: HAMP domain-containing histidine kinase [Polyangiaceae bacterium]|nr:HAMP domain-containing histidine kinase [Polyangiaceae bacterium]